MNILKSNNALIALIPSKQDFEIAKTQCWYRIPLNSAPDIIKNNEAEYIAFYHLKGFQDEKYSVRWHAKVTKVSIVKRKDLFPLSKVKAESEYYKIEFALLALLAQPIVSASQRSFIFISTTKEKLLGCKEINELFNESPLEELLWNELVKQGN